MRRRFLCMPKANPSRLVRMAANSREVRESESQERVLSSALILQRFGSLQCVLWIACLTCVFSALFRCAFNAISMHPSARRSDRLLFGRCSVSAAFHPVKQPVKQPTNFQRATSDWLVYEFAKSFQRMRLARRWTPEAHQMSRRRERLDTQANFSHRLPKRLFEKVKGEAVCRSQIVFWESAVWQHSTNFRKTIRKRRRRKSILRRSFSRESRVWMPSVSLFEPGSSCWLSRPF